VRRLNVDGDPLAGRGVTVYRVYGDYQSGNCYKVRLLMSHLGIDYEWVARFVAKYLGLPDERREEFEAKKEGGYRALGVMETQLGNTPYLVDEAPTIADLSLYAYTHVAHEGGFELAAYPAVKEWLDRVASLPGHVGMTD
jgi:glutathione S-transferase